jgi:hypothetical protein
VHTNRTAAGSEHGLSDWVGLPPSLTRAGRGRLAPTADGLRATQAGVLRAFAATGQPPPPDALTAAGAVDVNAALARLHAEDFLRLNGSGRIVAAYPFSGTPTPHVVHIEAGPRVFAMCAIDALGVAGMLGRATRIHSRDPANGQSVTIDLDGAGHLGEIGPPTAVVLVGGTVQEESCAAADTCCSTVSFFASSATAQMWLDAHRGVRGPVLDLDAALDMADEVFGHLLADDNSRLS